jgi:hypothetical protein
VTGSDRGAIDRLVGNLWERASLGVLEDRWLTVLRSKEIYRTTPDGDIETYGRSHPLCVLPLFAGSRWQGSPWW